MRNQTRPGNSSAATSAHPAMPDVHHDTVIELPDVHAAAMSATTVMDLDAIVMAAPKDTSYWLG